jgi:magnesium chelatase subunit H
MVMRSYVLAGNTGHYDGVIRALEARGLKVIPAFASGLDARPAASVLRQGRRPIVDAVVSLTGFSLVGGPAYNDAKRRRGGAGRLDVPYLAAHAMEFQTLEQWQGQFRSRPDAGGGDHHGRHPRAGRLHRADGLRRSLSPAVRAPAPQGLHPRHAGLHPERAERLAAASIG